MTEIVADSSYIVAVDNRIQVVVATNGLQGPPGASGGGGGDKLSVAYVAQSSFSALRVVLLNSSGKWEYASANNPSHAHKAIALLTEAVAADQSTSAVLTGRVADNDWNWSITQPIFLGINGLLTQSPPVSGFLRSIAEPLTPTQIWFAPSQSIVL